MKQPIQTDIIGIIPPRTVKKIVSNIKMSNLINFKNVPITRIPNYLQTKPINNEITVNTKNNRALTQLNNAYKTMQKEKNRERDEVLKKTQNEEIRKKIRNAITERQTKLKNNVKEIKEKRNKIIAEESKQYFLKVNPKKQEIRNIQKTIKNIYKNTQNKITKAKKIYTNEMTNLEKDNVIKKLRQQEQQVNNRIKKYRFGLSKNARKAARNIRKAKGQTTISNKIANMFTFK